MMSEPTKTGNAMDVYISRLRGDGPIPPGPAATEEDLQRACFNEEQRGIGMRYNYGNFWIPLIILICVFVAMWMFPEAGGR